MSYYHVPIEVRQKVLKFAEQCLGINLILTTNVLFPKSVYITDTLFSDAHPEKFILIFDVKKNYSGIKTGNIRYFQIPLHLRHNGLAKKVYRMLEKEFINLGCQMVSVEATVDRSDQSHTTVSFWEGLGFKKSAYCSPDDDVYPMYKYL
ncbi:hypothetical protein JOC37_002031 [Desulfohalotomaculum tongense]|uniref:hypothetical protein n=1 Tax=Desulforadius tongensis TaxID=1216062 RepID=UPI0019598C95|nr:hypothetical protein [Desulforadius tongensis]MBM7855629.1 hypothetical protein [Desulforadius tongensis]